MNVFAPARTETIRTETEYYTLLYSRRTRSLRLHNRPSGTTYATLDRAALLAIKDLLTLLDDEERYGNGTH